MMKQEFNVANNSSFIMASVTEALSLALDVRVLGNNEIGRNGSLA